MVTSRFSWSRSLIAAATAAVLSVAVVPGADAFASPETATTPDATTSTSHGEDTVSPEELLGLPEAPDTRRNAAEDIPVAAYVQAAHTIDVAVVVPSGSKGWASALDDTAVRSLLATTGAYWNTQSNNQVLSITPNASIQRYASPYSCSQQQDAWKEAAVKFGRTGGLSSYMTGDSRHLLVLVPADCGGTGLGSLGTFSAEVSAANGGTIWASVGTVNQADVVAHEFGHNLGLSHSNTHFCPDASITEGGVGPADSYSDGCYDKEYGDAFDVMGAAWSVTWNGAVLGNARPTALNISHQLMLGATRSGEVQTLALAAGKTSEVFTTSLASTGAASGRQALEITDPRTGQVYYVDYRGGGGSDAGSLYETGYLSGIGVKPGVRVLTTRPDNTSVVLLKPDAASRDGHKLYLAAGETLSTRSGGITVRVQSVSGVAAVTVTLSLPNASAQTVSRISGLDRFATSAAISRESFDPGVAAVYISSGTDFPDALSAAPVAGMQNSPVLLAPYNTLPAVIQTELERLNPAHIYIVGGNGVISDTVKAQLAQFTTGTAAVTRLAGPDRYETSATISRESFNPGVDAVYISSGTDFPDALSAAPVAGMQNSPLLLVPANNIPGTIQTELERLNPAHIYIVGGNGVVSDNVQTQLAQFAR